MEEQDRILWCCSSVHYHQPNMAETTARCRGNLAGFLDFLGQAWGWKIDFQPAAGEILVDENKPACLCPLMKNKPGLKSGLLCLCLEGFAERMFSDVTGRPVSASVEHSILRGDPTCVYRIRL